MSLAIENAPYITIYRNSLVYIMNNKNAVQTAFDVNSNIPFFLITTLKKLNDDSTIIFKGNISTGSDPVNPIEGLNQLDLSIYLENGVYSIQSIEISLNGSVEDFLPDDSVLFKPNYNVPSIEENLLRIM